MLKFEFMVEAIIIFIKNTKKANKCYVCFISKSVIWTVIIYENFSFLRAINVLKSEFSIEAIIIFVKSIKKASSGMFTLLVSQLYEL